MASLAARTRRLTPWHGITVRMAWFCPRRHGTTGRAPRGRGEAWHGGNGEEAVELAAGADADGAEGFSGMAETADAQSLLW
jgi:hypothetical protein